MSAPPEQHPQFEVTAPELRVPELMVLGTRTPLGAYLRDLWTRRHFARGLADSDMRAKHMNSVLGQFWHLLNPAMMIFVYWLVFGLILDARRGVENYISFLVVGVIIFRFTQNAIMGAAKSIAANLGLIRSIQFPRALVPISEVYAQLLALLPGIVLVAVVAAIDGVRPGPELLALPVVIGAAAMFSTGIGLMAARASTTLADLQQVLPHVFRILLYMSGVLFSVDAAIESQAIKDLFALNPFYCIITATRWAILGTPTSIWVPIALAIWTVLAVVIGFAWFRRGEHRYGA
jgi:teichoic acid transport system permease protein